MQHLTITSLSHPAVIAKIDRAMHQAIAEARTSKWRDCGHGKAYVADRKGNLFMRVSWFRDQGFVFYGRESINVTDVVLRALRKHTVTTEQAKQRPAFELVKETLQ